MNKRNQKETTVEEASRLLTVTPRTVINYINTKQIEAIKVGKSWFISMPSLEAFKQRYNLGAVPATIEKTDHTEIQENKISEKDTISGKPNPSKRKSNPVSTLRLFQMARETLKEINSADLFNKNDTGPLSKFDNLKMEAIELIGAGFYSFDNKLKARLYDHSRAKVGGMLSLFYFYNNHVNDIPIKIKRLEEELMPAYSSLIRKIEIKTDRTPKKFESKKT